MPRLFLKLFGTFWLTTVLILTVSIFASFRLADDAASRQAVDPREADELLREVLEDRGIEGLRAWIANSANFAPGQTIYVVDEQGHEILERAVPDYLQRRLSRMWEFAERHRGDEPGDRRRGRGGDFSAILVAADGTRWVSIPGPAPFPRFGILSYGGMRWILLLLAAVTSLISFWLLSRSLSRPARHISHAVDRFAQGDLSARVGEAGYSNDETGQIGRQFDRMASELEAQAHSRRELFRNISHEMRAPLARLQIAAELLERQPDKVAVQLERIRSEVAVLDNLTAQVLSLARATQAEPAGGRADIATVIARVAANAEVEASEKNIALQCSAPAIDACAQVDELLLVSAIENVVRNALQATPTGGRVTIDTILADSTCTITVTDSGAGVPEGELEKIFAPFYRLDTNRAGAGIGLAITARVLSQIGGAVQARNAAGGGLVVTLTIPVSALPPGPD